MKNVSVYLDLEWINTYLQERGFALTPAIIAQQIRNSAHPFGILKDAVGYGNPDDISEGVRETLNAEGLRFSAGPVERLFHGADDIDGLRNRTVILVSNGALDPQPFQRMRENGCEVILWHGANGIIDLDLWDRTDIIDRILQLQMRGIGICIDFAELIDAVWDSLSIENVELLLDRIDSSLAVEGTIISKVACADWHMLRVLRDSEGNPITHEAERICRNAGYQTFDIAQEREGAFVSALKHLLSRGDLLDSIVYIGGDIGENAKEILEQFDGDVRLCSSEPMNEITRYRWKNIKDLFNGGDPSPGSSIDSGFPVFMPGLWSRVGLHVDRVLSANGKEWISGSQLSRHFTKSLPFVKFPKQAEILIHSGVRNGVIKRRAMGSFHRDLFTLNETHNELVLIRELLKSLLDILGNDPTNLKTMPLRDVVDELHEKKLSVSGTPLSKTSVRSWISFLVDEGILIRLTLPVPGETAHSIPHITISPEPPSAKPERGGRTGDNQSVAKKSDSRKKNNPKNRPSGLLDHIIVAVDNYMIRYGKDHAPVQSIKRQISGYSDRAVSGAIQHGLKTHDLISPRGGGSKDQVRNGMISLGMDSQHVRQIISRKQRIIDLLRRMAPMGQPMGEGRIRSAFVNDLKMRSDQEAGEWIDLLLKERLLKPDQIVSELGRSYTLALDDPVVVNNKTPSLVRKQSSRPRRSNRPGDKRRFSNRRSR